MLDPYLRVLTFEQIYGSKKQYTREIAFKYNYIEVIIFQTINI